MPSAICPKCGRITSWRATRGARLADLRCACGGALSSARPFRIRYAARSNPEWHFKQLHFTEREVRQEAARMRSTGYHIDAVEQRVGKSWVELIESIPQAAAV